MMLEAVYGELECSDCKETVEGRFIIRSQPLDLKGVGFKSTCYNCESKHWLNADSIQETPTKDVY